MEILRIKDFAEYLKPRSRQAFKNDFGHVLIVGGDYGYSGAVRLAGEAALRVGAGLVSIATRPEYALILNATRPELMCHGVTSTAQLKSLLKKANVVVIGPGMGQSSWAKKLLHFVFKNASTLVVDADGLNLLAKKPVKKSHWILTPHPGEAARLLKSNTQAIQDDRMQSASQIQKKFGGVCVLKGAGTLVAVPDAEVVWCDAGNPGMATAGTGDVLSGVIGGLLAQGIPLQDAAKLGVLIHALAGDEAAQHGGERGMIASDLLPFLRGLVNGGVG